MQNYSVLEFKAIKVAEVLKSLNARNPEERAALGFVLHCADFLCRGVAAEAFEVGRLLTELPEELKRYLYGLVEAIEIYQSIRGVPISIQELSNAEQSIHDLRQIRDMCLEDGLRTIY